ncbi:alpha/beta fold hydrolase [Aurantimonas sp. A2-1-M11]
MAHDDQPPTGPGGGVPLLLLHGAVQTRAVWAGQMAALAARHRVIVPDLRGHGATPLGHERLTIERMAQDCLVLLDRLGIDRVAVCGVSLGGMVALEMAARAPETVTALVLSNTPRSLSGSRRVRRLIDRLDPQRLLHPAFRILGQARTARIGLALAATLVGPFWVGRAARRHFIAGFATMSPEAIVATYRALVESRPLDLDRIGCPCLVVDTLHDATTIREQAADIVAEAPNARSVVLEGGHVANLDNPAVFNRVLADFIEAPGRWK